MENVSCTLLDKLKLKHSEKENNNLNKENEEESSTGVRTKLRALMVALFGISMSLCAIASQPVELELEDDEVAQRLNNVTFARRITKPTIRLVIGYGTLSASVTAVTSLLLLVAVMSKKSWWQRGARWLAAPALLVAALEAASDASDVLLVTILRSSETPLRLIVQSLAACALITTEILIWWVFYIDAAWVFKRDRKFYGSTLAQGGREYICLLLRYMWDKYYEDESKYFIAKFFEYNPAIPVEDKQQKVKEN